VPLLGVFEVPKYSISIIFFSGIIYAGVRMLVSQWIDPGPVLSFDKKMPFFDYMTVLCANLMIWEILLFIAALGVFGLYYTLYLIKKAVFPQGIRWGTRGALNISGAEELPAPYYERNDDKIKYSKFSFASRCREIRYNFHLSDVITAEYILQVFVLVFIGALTTVITRFAVSITGSIVAVSTTDSWGMVLALLYPVAVTWLAAFIFSRLFISIFVHTIRGSIFKQL
jgi:hypothetical protein